MALPTRNPTFWIVIAAIVAGALGLLLGRSCCDAPGDAPLQAGLRYPNPVTVPEFELQRTDGSRYATADLRGHWTFLFFGFTHCPDVCPTTLGTYKQLIANFGPAANMPRPQWLFVSVDPDRDDAQTLANYTGYFSPEIIALRGDDAALQPLTRQLGVVYMKAPLDHGDYTVDHSAQILLLDPQARVVAIFRPPHDAARIAADFRTLAQ
jgi:protein SCO1